MSAAAALWPAQPTTEPPGWVPALAEYRPWGGGGREKGPGEGSNAQYLVPSEALLGHTVPTGAIACRPPCRLFPWKAGALLTLRLTEEAARCLRAGKRCARWGRTLFFGQRLWRRSPRSALCKAHGAPRPPVGPQHTTGAPAAALRQASPHPAAMCLRSAGTPPAQACGTESGRQSQSCCRCGGCGRG